MTLLLCYLVVNRDIKKKKADTALSADKQLLLQKKEEEENIFAEITYLSKRLYFEAWCAVQNQWSN